MSAEEEIRLGLAAALGEEVDAVDAVGGGDLNEACRARLADGTEVFVKSRDGADPEEYEVEAAALKWLADPGEVRTARVVAVGKGDGGGAPAFLALEWVDSGRLSSEGAENLGRGLARAHRAGAPGFGARPESAEGSRLHIGPLAFPDPQVESWPEFYAEHRLIAVARMARDKGALAKSAVGTIEQICNRIEELAGPVEPPSRLHGDLWSGNVMADASGEAVLIDPAAYGGHREIDLAMLRLFGVPDERIFTAYEEEWPPAEGAAERVGLWQLFPLLVHAALFGGGYGERVAQLACRYL